MSRRAARIMEDEPPPSTTSSGGRKFRKYTEQQIVYRWKRVSHLITLIFQHIQLKAFLLWKMPKETVDPSSSDSEYEKVDVPGEAPSQSSKDKPQPWRVETHENVKYVIGKQLEPGKGVKDRAKITHDPQLCQHPTESLLGRGGRGEMHWWYCQACGSRFKRIPLSQFEMRSEGTCSIGSDMITFGKHLGKSCKTVYDKHPEYCLWILSTAETGDAPCQGLKKFAKYIASRGPPDLNSIPAGRMDEPL